MPEVYGLRRSLAAGQVLEALLNNQYPGQDGSANRDNATGLEWGASANSSNQWGRIGGGLT
jgi:hypothetical protein